MSRLKELRTPVFGVEGHPGTLDREGWSVEVSGLCRNPRTFTWRELVEMPKAIADARLTSVTRFSVRGRWGGVKVAHLFDAVQVEPSSKYVRFWSHKKIYDTSIPIEMALRERTLLAYEFDGEYLLFCWLNNIAPEVHHGCLILGKYTLTAEDLESGMTPFGEHVDQVFCNSPSDQEHLEDLVPENRLQFFQVQGRSDPEYASPVEVSVCYQNMEVGIESEEVAKGLDGDDGAG